MNFLSLFRRDTPNPGRDLAMIRVRNERAKVHAVARQMRAELGLPAVEVLRD